MKVNNPFYKSKNGAIGDTTHRTCRFMGTTLGFDTIWLIWANHVELKINDGDRIYNHIDGGRISNHITISNSFLVYNHDLGDGCLDFSVFFTHDFLSPISWSHFSWETPLVFCVLGSPIAFKRFCRCTSNFIKPSFLMFSVACSYYFLLILCVCFSLFGRSQVMSTWRPLQIRCVASPKSA